MPDLGNPLDFEMARQDWAGSWIFRRRGSLWRLKKGGGILKAGHNRKFWGSHFAQKDMNRKGGGKKGKITQLPCPIRKSVRERGDLIRLSLRCDLGDSREGTAAYTEF